ncbi:MAG: hypothetical protein ACI86M_003921 [Saprospiraceae bacterium]
MNYKITIFFILLSIIWGFSCNNVDKLSKEDYLYTDRLNSGIYFERYRVDSYGIGGDKYSIYLTDSIKFRKFISLYYDNESFEYFETKDTISIVKMKDLGGYNGIKQTQKEIEKYTFQTSKLKSSNVFE